MRALRWLAGCEHDLVKDLPDAAIPDAPPDAALYCPTPADPSAPGTHKVFLNTEGVTLQTGCGDDATRNCTQLILTNDTNVPTFLPGVPGRETYIAKIIAIAQGVLAPYSIDIVTTRPATGPYQMIVLGGEGMAVTGQCQGCGALSLFVCEPAPSAVDLVFDLGYAQQPYVYANTILGDLAIINGLTSTTLPGDCTCRNDEPCLPPPAELCTFGTNLTTTLKTYGSPPVPINCGNPTQDEPALLKTNLGCR